MGEVETLESKADQEISKEQEERLIESIKDRKREIRSLNNDLKQTQKRIDELNEEISKINKGGMEALEEVNESKATNRDCSCGYITVQMPRFY
jgi:iron uptake system EfeUOB component EfeO/EfeM